MEFLRGYIIKEAAAFEQSLRAMGGRGKGLKELTQSVDSQLTPEVKAALKHITYIRNAAAHEIDFAVEPHNRRKVEQNLVLVKKFFADYQQQQQAKAKKANKRAAFGKIIIMSAVVLLLAGLALLLH